MLVGVVLVVMLAGVGCMLVGCSSPRPPGAPAEPEATVDEVPLVEASADIVADAVVAAARLVT